MKDRSISYSCFFMTVNALKTTITLFSKIESSHIMDIQSHAAT